MLKATFLSKDVHNHGEDGTTYWFTLDGVEVGINESVSARGESLVTAVDSEGYPIDSDELWERRVIDACVVTDEMRSTELETPSRSLAPAAP